MTISLPNPNPDWIYEGTDPASYEDINGLVANRAPKQIQANVESLLTVVQNLSSDQDNYTQLLYLLSGAPIFDSTKVYSKYDIVYNPAGNIYSSLQDNNSENLLTDTNWWSPVTININDNIITNHTTWSSSKIDQFVLNTIDPYNLRALMAILNGAQSWSSTVTYKNFDIVTDNSGDLYVSIQDYNTNNTLTDTSWWKPVTININDGVTTLNTTWSSSFIQSKIDVINAEIGAFINDSTITTTSTWSSSKINTDITNLTNTINSLINDGVTVSDKTWSSFQIQGNINNLQNEINSIINDNVTNTTETWSSSKIQSFIDANSAERLHLELTSTWDAGGPDTVTDLNYDTISYSQNISYSSGQITPGLTGDFLFSFYINQAQGDNNSIDLGFIDNTTGNYFNFSSGAWDTNTFQEFYTNSLDSGDGFIIKTLNWGNFFILPLTSGHNYSIAVRNRTTNQSGAGMNIQPGCRLYVTN